MSEDLTPTCYASAKRSQSSIIEKQLKLIKKNEILVNLVESISQLVVVLNQDRQIVFANSGFIEFCGVKSIKALLGKRPGESINCLYAFQEDGGCGTSEFCKKCGAVNAILESQTGVKSTKDCNILTSGNEAFELRVTATPFDLDNEEFTIFSITDISAEKRRETLESVFLHDIMNSAGGISGLSNILKDMNDPKEMVEIARIIETAASNLIDEIKIQRELSSAERGDLKPIFTPVSSLQVLTNLQNIYTSHRLNHHKIIELSKNSKDIIFETDSIILKRILGNMIKNAIEVNQLKDTIVLKSEVVGDEICFSVHNNSFIPYETQLQLFKRSFSTKGVGRGLGTYSMKLLGEKYLKGKVWFDSDQKKGTTFYIQLKIED